MTRRSAVVGPAIPPWGVVLLLFLLLANLLLGLAAHRPQEQAPTADAAPLWSACAATACGDGDVPVIVVTPDGDSAVCVGTPVGALVPVPSALEGVAL